MEEAITSFRKATQSKQVYADAYHNLALALAQNGAYDDAVTECQKLLALVAPFLDQTPDAVDGVAQLRTGLAALLHQVIAGSSAHDEEKGQPRAETLLVRITSIRGCSFRGKLASAPASRTMDFRVGTAVVFTTDHIHSLVKGRRPLRIAGHLFDTQAKDLP